MVTPDTNAARRFACPVDGFQQMISGKYKLRILWSLKDGPRRYGALRKELNNTRGVKLVAPRVLSRELKALTGLGLIHRRDFHQTPLRVEYSLARMGESLLPVIGAMHRWGVEHLVRESVVRRGGTVMASAGR